MILYRMHINLGDLYRYSCSTKLAEECYLKASKLAPATGNPFNQLAVISQSQESLTAVSLYYYARSLMATNEPFDKSRTNMLSLLEDNKKWLEEHVRDDDSHSRAIVAGNIEANSSIGKRSQREWIMKEKSAINRKFLAQLVDLQWDFMKGVSLDGSDMRIHLDELLSKMSSIIASFTDLLASASFSESLLCKLVATMAFSTLTASNQGKLCSTKGLSAKRSKDPIWNEGFIMTNQALAFSFVLRFCTVLANHFYGHMTKRENKPNASSLINIRSLTPLLLGSSFITSIYEGSDWFHGLVFYRNDESSGDSMSSENNSIRNLCTTSQIDFSQSTAKISEHLSEFRKGLSQQFESVSFRDVKEYSEYYGFFPFHSFLTRNGGADSRGVNDIKPSEYVTIEEAINTLSSEKLASGSKSSDLETTIKVCLLLANATQKGFSTDEYDVAATSIEAKLSQALLFQSILDETKPNKNRSNNSIARGEKSSPTTIRNELFQLFREVLLANPTLSLEQDVIGRTWKYCFYGHIKQLRCQITLKKETGEFAIASSAKGSDVVPDNLEQELLSFSNSAIPLYNDLIDQYTKMLSPLSQTSNTKASQDDSDDKAEQAIIMILYRMHINLGDLYRYSCSTKLAEECYLKASKLAPATGNPFNQLAVISQSQESLTAVSLYYYARSLMATNEPFDKSRTNMLSLLEDNKKWLEEHVRDDDSHSRAIVAGNIEANSSIGKRSQREWIMKEKSAINRKFLAQLVDLQWDFMKGVSLDGSDMRIHLDELLSKMSSIIASFTDLLASASFSESLLCKLVATMAFSTLTASNQGKLCSTKGLSAKRSKDPIWNEGFIMTNQALAFSFVLRFCTVLANHFYGHMTKRENKPNASSLINIRSLTPLLLGSSFITSIYEGSDWFHGLVFYRNDESSGDSMSSENNSIRNLCTTSQIDFSQSTAKISEHLSEFRKGLSQQFESVSFRDVKEYSEYYGFFPFHSFLTRNGGADSRGVNDIKPSEYVTIEEAINTLSSEKLASGSKSSDLETTIKAFLLLKNSDNIITAIKISTSTVLKGQFGADALCLPIPEKDRIYGNEGIVILTTTYSRTGVPLLVPGTLINNGPIGVEQSPAPPNNYNAENVDRLEGLNTIGFAQSINMSVQGNHDDVLKSMNLSHSDDLLHFTGIPTHSDPSSREYPKQKIKPLAPPPGFAIPTQPHIEHPQKVPHSHDNTSDNIILPLSSNISNRMFSSELPVFSRIHQNSNQQASPEYAMNPFAKSATPINDISAQHSAVNLNSFARNNTTNERHNSNDGFDPTFDFNLSRNGLHSSDGMTLSDPSPEDRNNSLLKFLFEADDDDGRAHSTPGSQKRHSAT